MNLAPRFETVPEKKLVGKKLAMSLLHNRSSELWRSFMPQRGAITNAVGAMLYSIHLYQPDYFVRFDPGRTFVQWAATEVTDHNVIPGDMDAFILPEGLYAVFAYKGASTDTAVFQYIFGEWLPASGYVLDDRPHFEVLGAQYRNADPESEEDIYIPVKPKS